MSKDTNSHISFKLNSELDDVMYYFSPAALSFLSGTTEGVSNWTFLNDLLSRMTVTEKRTTKRGITTELKPGEVEASMVFLSEEWRLGRKVVTRLIVAMEDCGILARESNNLTTIIAITCVIGWHTHGKYHNNPHSNFRKLG